MGTLRLYLALCVFVSHYYVVGHPTVLPAAVAVFCFFILSGFYMAMTIAENYGNDARGARRFYANRALRLYPSYLAVIFGVVALHASGVVLWGISGFNADGPLISRLPDMLNQATVLPNAIWRNLTLDTNAASNTLNLAWCYTVGIEGMFYLVAPFIVLRRLPVLIVTFVGSLGLHFLPATLGLDARQWQYDFFPATLVFFLAGVLAYRLYVVTRTIAFPRAIGWAGLAAVVASGWAPNPFAIFTNSPWIMAFYAAVALAVPFLFMASKGSRIDRLLGDLAYPFFVVQGIAGPLLGGGFGSSATPFWTTMALALAVSLGLRVLVERPIEGLRNRLRVATSPVQVAATAVAPAALLAP